MRELTHEPAFAAKLDPMHWMRVDLAYAVRRALKRAMTRSIVGSSISASALQPSSMAGTIPHLLRCYSRTGWRRRELQGVLAWCCIIESKRSARHRNRHRNP